MASTLVDEIYCGKIRLRVCGILQNQDKVLLLNHKFLNPENIFWNFPGGGLEPGETIEECLKREFLEETNLSIQIHELIYVNQFIHDKLHAIELYFRVSSSNFEAKLGFDPEINVLTDLKWFTKNQILQLPKSQLPNFITSIAFKNINELL